MILQDCRIKQLIDERAMIMTDKEFTKIQPASYDMRLGTGFKRIKRSLGLKGLMRFDEEIKYVDVEPVSADGSVILDPGEFMLATTEEAVRLPDYISAFVEGRSSIGRMGLFIHNAGFIDPGFEGQITLELFNASPNPILLTPGTRICQLVFFEMSGSAVNAYDGKYQHQVGTTGSRINLDTEVINPYDMKELEEN